MKWKLILASTTAAVLAGALAVGGLYASRRAEPRADEGVRDRTLVLPSDWNGGLESKLTPANEELRKFPEKIAGAGEIRKYETPGAQYCLVHIKQLHNLSSRAGKIENDTLRDFATAKYVEVDDVQRDIASIITELALPELMDIDSKNKNYCEIWNEGSAKFTSEEEDRKRYLAKMAVLASNLDFELKNADDLKGLQSWYAFAPGAVELTAKKLGLKILPASDAEVDAKAREDPSYIYEPREDVVLKRVAEYGKPVGLLVCGGAHNFRNNIERWNKANPNKKYSLIEVTPSSYNQNSVDENNKDYRDSKSE